MFDPGDYAIAVRWLHRVSDDSEQRSFEYDATTPQMTLNSTELPCVKIELDTVKQAQQVRRSPRAGAQAAQRQHVQGAWGTQLGMSWLRMQNRRYSIHAGELC